MRPMRATFSAVGCLAICAVSLSCNSSRRSNPELGGPSSDSLTRTQTFAAGQQVKFEMNVGDVQVQPSSGESGLRLEIRPKHPVSTAEMQSWIKQFEISGHQADIRLKVPRQANAQVILEVPSSTSLEVNMGVGNLTIDRISGDKDVNIGVGNLTMAGLHRDDYGSVKITTGVGNVDDSVFSGQQSGMVGKSESATGPGKFHISAHLGTGNIGLKKGSASGTD